jgi:hypothetical protein
VPRRSRHASPTCLGKASPADVLTRTELAPSLVVPAWASIDAKSVGTPQKMVGRCSRSACITAAGVGRSAMSTAVAPTARGNVSALPRPYAKKSLAAEKTTSSSRMPRTPCA